MAMELANAGRFDTARAVYAKLVDAVEAYSGDHPWMAEPYSFLTFDEFETPLVEGTKRIIGGALIAAEARAGEACALVAPSPPWIEEAN